MKLVRTTIWCAYECPPIDEWEGTIGVEEYLSVLSERGETIQAIEDFVLVFEGGVRVIADLTTWEGDGTWMVSTLPDVVQRQMRVMFYIKQRNNGTVFIASTAELPWLARYERKPGDDFQPQIHPSAQASIKRIRQVEREVIDRRRRSAVH